MARYTGPATRKSRRLGVDLVGGDQSFEKRPYPPGAHGKGRIKESDDVGRSLGADRRKSAKTRVKSGQGDRGDR